MNRNQRMIGRIFCAVACCAIFMIGCGTSDPQRPPHPRYITHDSPSITAAKSMVLVNSITIFALAVFVGFEVITKVPPTLHTPLMSGSNAISGITIVGALLAAGAGGAAWGTTWGFLAVILATINVVGGFLVTGRMLAMFKRKP